MARKNELPKNELTIIRMLNAPREKVWRACREPEALKAWWGLPNNATMPTCNIDFRLDGVLHCQIMHRGTEIWFKWIYREIVEDEKLVMEQHLSDAAGRELDSPERATCFNDHDALRGCGRENETDGHACGHGIGKISRRNVSTRLVGSLSTVSLIT